LEMYQTKKLNCLVLYIYTHNLYNLILYLFLLYGELILT